MKYCSKQFLVSALAAVMLWQGCAADAVSGLQSEGSAQARIAWLEQRIPAVGPVDPEQLKQLLAELARSAGSLVIPTRAEDGCRAAYAQACELTRDGGASFGELDVCGRAAEDACAVTADVWLERAQSEAGLAPWFESHVDALGERIAVALANVGQDRLASRLRELVQSEVTAGLAPLWLTAMQGGSSGGGGQILLGVAGLLLMVTAIGIGFWARNYAVTTQLAPNVTVQDGARPGYRLVSASGFDNPELGGHGPAGGSLEADEDFPLDIYGALADLQELTIQPAVCIAACKTWDDQWMRKGDPVIGDFFVPIGVGAASDPLLAQTIALSSLALQMHGKSIDEAIVWDIVNGNHLEWNRTASSYLYDADCHIRMTCTMNGLETSYQNMPASVP